MRSWIGGVAVLMVLAAAGCTMNRTDAAPASSTTARGGAAPATVLATRPPVLTDEQLRAHDGVGVPKGWAPVDAGAARVWVPAHWTLLTPGSCIADGTVRAIVSIGKLAQANCGSPKAAQAIALFPSTPADRGAFVRVIHGYRVYAMNTVKSAAALTVYDVPRLGLQIGVRGRDADRALDTLAPSARTVALMFAGKPSPSSYRSVTEDGITLSIPADWTVPKPGAYCYVQRHELIRVHFTGPALCAALIPDPTSTLVDGAMVFASPDQFGSENAHPVAVLVYGTSTVMVYATDSGQTEFQLEVIVRRSGSATGRDLLLGLGRNGRVAGGVLASIKAAT